VIVSDSFVVADWTDPGAHPGRPIAGSAYLQAIAARGRGVMRVFWRMEPFVGLRDRMWDIGARFPTKRQMRGGTYVLRTELYGSKTADP
jgi:hypothetical protein